jgi:disulfide bond formation protein DsbB
MTPADALARARLIALLTPVLLLGGALLSQYVGGLFPCEMCMWQRWPHLLAIFFALDAYVLRARPQIAFLFTALAALAIAVSGAIGVFHAGVEYGWWEGLTTCTASTTGETAQDMLNSIMNAPLIRCDVAPWTLMGISLAGFNALFSLGAAALIATLLLRCRRG